MLSKRRGPGGGSISKSLFLFRREGGGELPRRAIFISTPNASLLASHLLAGARFYYYKRAGAPGGEVLARVYYYLGVKGRGGELPRRAVFISTPNASQQASGWLASLSHPIEGTEPASQQLACWLAICWWEQDFITIKERGEVLARVYYLGVRGRGELTPRRAFYF